MDNNRQVLDSLLGLAVMCVPPTAQPLFLASQAFW